MAGHCPIVGLDDDDSRCARGQILRDLLPQIRWALVRRTDFYGHVRMSRKNPLGAGVGIRSCRTNATSGARTVSGLEASLKPISVTNCRSG